jgi:hypothetical protein
MISIPITLDQLIIAVQNLQPEEQIQVDRALVQSKLTLDLAALIQELYCDPPADDISDEEIMVEIQSVRQQLR